MSASEKHTLVSSKGSITNPATRIYEFCSGKWGENRLTNISCLAFRF